jgi:uncharacterized protein (TIGR02466 family)
VFVSQTVNACFPSHVWELQLEGAAAMATQLGALVRGTPSPAAQSADVRNSRLRQTSETLHLRAEAQPLLEAVRVAAELVARKLCLDCGLGVTSMWGNVYSPGALIPYHTHPNNYLSGVYYVEAEESAGDLVFYDPRPQVAVMAPEPTQYNLLNAGRFSLEPKAGKLVLFPAWLPHSSNPNQSGRDRVSISFNLALCGDYGVSMARAQVLTREPRSVGLEMQEQS